MIDKRLGFLIVPTLALLLVGGAGFGLRARRVPVPSGSSRDADRRGSLPPSNERVPYDPSLVGRTVAFWEKRAARDLQGALERRELAGAYLARHRETGDIADAVKAEEAARESLEDPAPQ